jgi:hypothetical protein
MILIGKRMDCLETINEGKRLSGLSECLGADIGADVRLMSGERIDGDDG